MKAVVAWLILLALVPMARGAEPAVKEIELPKFMPHLPEGPGRELFAANCLACHSTRYITMQPIVTQAKWEENVKKMIKTYGAPIAEENVTPLAQYVMAMQGSAPDSLSLAVQNPTPGALDRLHPGHADRGRKVYLSACASCHGESAKGDGPAMKNLLPVATDLTAGRFSGAVIERSITHGVPGTSMPAFPTLGGDDVQDVIAYLSTFSEKSDSPAPVVAEDVKKAFVTNCAMCHGESGGGDGLNAPTLARAPTNFRERRPSVDRAMKAIEDGVAGTAMPAWKAKLDPAQRKQLVEYVRSLYAGTTPPVP